MTLILITGMPGVGKTTIVRNLGLELQKRKIPLDGFYTEELRNASGERSGFDIVTFDGKRAPLARVSDTTKNSRDRVGKYAVCVAEFESVALPALNSRSANLLLLDEIGKMEMKSKSFAERMLQITDGVARGGIFFVATIPLKATLDIVERLKRTKNAQLFHVTATNRNQIHRDILEATVRMIGKQL
ncbi:cancer-related nucleoside-triphosphatase homolog isoform X2 [Armigeres subalbatus]